VNNKTKIKILGITYNQVQAGAYALIMAEENGNKRLPIVIGTPEAQSIAISLENLIPPRPLTHDLFVTFMQKLKINLKEVIINKYDEGVFFSEIVFNIGNKNIIIDSRTSDAIALALRTNSPIYIMNDIMNEVAVEVEENDNDYYEQKEKNKTAPIDCLSQGKLKQLLNEAIATENYEKASYIRDLINKK